MAVSVLPPTTLGADSLQPDKSGISELMNVAWGQHEFTDAYTAEVSQSGSLACSISCYLVVLALVILHHFIFIVADNGMVSTASTCAIIMQLDFVLPPSISFYFRVGSPG